MIGGITQAINQLWCESLGGQIIDDQTLIQALQDAGVVNDGEIVRCLDCRLPRDPQDTKRPRDHFRI